MNGVVTSTQRALLCVLLLPALAVCGDLESTIAKHVQARGGMDAWNKITSIKATGTYAAFSREAPFVLHRKRPDRYHFDHSMNGHKVVIGYNGQHAWWENGFYGPGAQPIEGIDLDVVMRDVEFASPFFNHRDKGLEVTYLGDRDFEGVPAIGLELTRANGKTETWYLDPETFLEIGYDAEGSDFGQPAPQRTVFDDYREVGGVMIPHYIESQFYTRLRVMMVEQLEINVEVDDSLFEMPPPPGMGPLLPLVGDWDIKLQTRGRPGADWQDAESQSSIQSMLRDGLLQEQGQRSDGTPFVRSYSYDPFAETYRVTQIDQQETQLSVMQGVFDDEGRLTVDNVGTDTPRDSFGTTIYARVSLLDIGDDHFTLHYEISRDKGENWFLAAKANYSRRQSSELEAKQ